MCTFHLLKVSVMYLNLDREGCRWSLDDSSHLLRQWSAADTIHCLIAISSRKSLNLGKIAKLNPVFRGYTQTAFTDCQERILLIFCLNERRWILCGANKTSGCIKCREKHRHTRQCLNPGIHRLENHLWMIRLQGTYRLALKWAQRNNYSDQTAYFVVSLISLWLNCWGVSSKTMTCLLKAIFPKIRSL